MVLFAIFSHVYLIFARTTWSSCWPMALDGDIILSQSLVLGDSLLSSYPTTMSWDKSRRASELLCCRGLRPCSQSVWNLQWSLSSPRQSQHWHCVVPALHSRHWLLWWAAWGRRGLESSPAPSAKHSTLAPGCIP